MNRPGGILAVGLALLLTAPVQAQNAIVPFSGIKHDNTLPVELAADELSIDQARATATFTGNVIVAQGELKISAESMVVHYQPQEGDSTGTIESIEAAGNVILTNGAESAQGGMAVYEVATGIVTMTEQVILTQGSNALSGSSLRIDLVNGTAMVAGRVQTIFQPGTAN